jgi:hypothetical protein
VRVCPRRGGRASGSLYLTKLQLILLYLYSITTPHITMGHDSGDHHGRSISETPSERGNYGQSTRQHEYREGLRIPTSIKYKLGAVVVSLLDVPSFLPPLAFYLSSISPPSAGLIQDGELSRGGSSAASLSSLEGIIAPRSWRLLCTSDRDSYQLTEHSRGGLRCSLDEYPKVIYSELVITVSPNKEDPCSLIDGFIEGEIVSSSPLAGG